MAAFRNAFYRLVPSWLSTGDGEKVLFAVGLLLDAFAERMRASLAARYPSYADDSALALIGADRGIPRGRAETREHYAERLKRWRYPRGHRTRGSCFALLEQVGEYFGGMQVETRDVGGNAFARTAAGAESAAHGVAWDWDGNSASWARLWLVLFPVPTHDVRAWPTFANGAWGSLDPVVNADKILGAQGVTQSDLSAMRRLLHGRPSWLARHVFTQWAVLSLAAKADTTLTPAGTWGGLGFLFNAPSYLRFLDLSP